MNLVIYVFTNGKSNHPGNLRLFEEGRNLHRINPLLTYKEQLTSKVDGVNIRCNPYALQFTKSSQTMMMMMQSKHQNL